MLYKANELIGLKLDALDGEIGKCRDLLFDDEHWAVRYMDAKAGNWLTGKRVLVSPVSLGEPDWEHGLFPVKLTQDQIADSPSVEEDQPISKRFEAQLFRYYGYGFYWMGEQPWGTGIYPAQLQLNAVPQGDTELEHGDVHLRSVTEVTGYSVYIGDDRAGSVDGFLIEHNSWMIRYLVVDTGKWLFHNRVLVPVAWIDDISWADHSVSMNMQFGQLKDAPAYNDDSPVTREYEEQYFRHFGHPPYWQ